MSFVVVSIAIKQTCWFRDLEKLADDPLYILHHGRNRKIRGIEGFRREEEVSGVPHAAQAVRPGKERSLVLSVQVDSDRVFLGWKRALLRPLGETEKVD